MCTMKNMQTHKQLTIHKLYAPGDYSHKQLTIHKL